MTKSPETKQFQSQPLATHQQSLLDEENEPKQNDHSQAVAPVPIPVVVDLNLNDLPEAVYEDFTFQLGDYVYTLQCESDAILYELHDLSLEDSFISELFDFFLTNTFKSGVHVDSGEHVTVEHLIENFYPPKGSGRKPRPFTHLQKIMTGAMEQWSSELTDTSMRPAQRSRHQVSRAERRRRR